MKNYIYKQKILERIRRTISQGCASGLGIWHPRDPPQTPETEEPAGTNRQVSAARVGSGGDLRCGRDEEQLHRLGEQQSSHSPWLWAVV